MIEKLTAPEIAVIIDCLMEVKRKLIGGAYETPNIDTALVKINGMMVPGTYALWITDEDPRDAEWEGRIE